MALGACSVPEKKIVNPGDYEEFLKSNTIKFVSEQKTIDFWTERLDANPTDQTAILKLAGLYAARFKSQGNINDIHLSDSLFIMALDRAVGGNAGIYQGLASNAITQHQFSRANSYLEMALLSGENKSASYLMLADVRMELGDTQGAKTILKEFSNKNAFAFLIRDTKIKDKEGKLDTAILIMEKALQRIGTNNTSLFCWAKSNLADMYGHAGKIEKSYNAYLEVLNTDPSYLYALKGIAWIAFSNDHDLKEAKRLINFVQTHKPSPDLYLLLAQIAEEENDTQVKNSMLARFKQEVTDPRYGAMYNKYIAEIEAEEGKPQRAIEIAMVEVKSRPTVESYDLLAWTLFKNGEVEEAIAVASKYVETKTYEPDALYHLGTIYAKKNPGKAKVFLEEAATSSFELGPSTTRTIQQMLNEL